MSLELFQNWLENSESLILSNEVNTKVSGFFFDLGTGEQNVSGQNSISSGPKASTEASIGKELDDAIATGDKNKTIDLLTESTGNAVTSILGLSKTRSGWNPLDPNSNQNQIGFQNFVKDILKVPLFTIIQSESTKVKYAEENFNSLIDKVTDLYDGATSADRNKIKSSITNLAKACTSRVNTQNTKTLFVQNTLNANSDTTVVALAQTFMMMEYSHQTGKGAPKDKYKTEVNVNILQLSFNKGIWNRDFATKLANKFVQSWDDWLDGTTTPKTSNSAEIKYCFSDK